MKIVFMGTPDFAVPSLQGLIDDGHEILAVYTQPDKPVGRKQVLTPPPVKALALEHGLPVYQPTKMRDGTVAAQLRELAPDLIAVVAYGRILPKEILEIPPYGCINVHGSLLPKYRGAGPIQWSVINGEAETGITTMYMGEGLDTGDILLVQRTPIGPEETAGELFDRLAPMGADCLKKTVRALEEKRITPVKQDEQKAALCPHAGQDHGRAGLHPSGSRTAQPDPGTQPLARGLYSLWRQEAQGLCRPGGTGQRGTRHGPGRRPVCHCLRREEPCVLPKYSSRAAAV